MKKHIINLKVTEAVRLGANYGKLSLTPADGSKLPEMLPVSLLKSLFLNVRQPCFADLFLSTLLTMNATSWLYSSETPVMLQAN